MAEAAWELIPAVSCHYDERKCRLFQSFHDGKGFLAVQIHVDNCAIKGISINRRKGSDSVPTGPTTLHPASRSKSASSNAMISTSSTKRMEAPLESGHPTVPRVGAHAKPPIRARRTR